MQRFIGAICLVWEIIFPYSDLIFCFAMLNLFAITHFLVFLVLEVGFGPN